MRDFSASNEVRALDRAVALIRARARSDEAFDDVSDALYDELNDLTDAQRAAAVADLIAALVRFGSVLALDASMRREDAIDVAYNALCKSTIDYDPTDDDPAAA